MSSEIWHKKKEQINNKSQLRVGERFASLADLDDSGSVQAGSNPVVWKASLVCSDIAVQVNDQLGDVVRRPLSEYAGKTHRLTPVVRLSCAWILEQSWYQDGSWDAECSLASLRARDLSPMHIASQPIDTLARCLRLVNGDARNCMWCEVTQSQWRHERHKKRQIESNLRVLIKL